MKQQQCSLPQLLKRVVMLEIFSFIASLMVPDPSINGWEETAFDYFWQGIWYLLALLWITGWVAILKNWRRGFEIYAAGWICSFFYSILSGPAASSPLGSVFEYFTTLAGGATLTLAWLRKCGTGDWTGQLAQERLNPREAIH